MMRLSNRLLNLLIAGTVATTPFLCSTSAIAQDATPTGIPLTASPLKTAKTIQVKALFSVMGQDGKPSPFFDVSIAIEKPDHYRIDATPLMNSNPPVTEKSFNFYDGKKQYEYNSLQKKYAIADAPKPGERWMSQLTTMASLRVIMTPDAPPGAGITRKTGEEVIEGRQLLTITDYDRPRTTKDGKILTAFNKVYFDAVTSMPVRTLEGYIEGDPKQADATAHPNLLLEFKDWRFDEALPPQTFVWAKPAGATEYNTGLAVGTPAPDFKAIDPSGKVVRLSDLKGKIVILDFWATWCGPCQLSMPHLEKIYKDVKDKNVAVLALCVWDTKDEYQKWIVAKKKTFSFPTAFDPGERVNSIASKLYMVTGIPTQYVIDQNGKVTACIVGYSEGQVTLERVLKSLKVNLTLSAEAPKTITAAKSR